MYEVFYNLTAEPFRLSPDHKFCYEHKGYAKARAYMAYAFTQAEGFVMITGRPGTGKTTLIGELVETLARDNVQTASLVCTQLAADDLLKAVAYSFGVEAEKTDKAELLQKLNVLFHRLHREGRRALLIVDEAQDLSLTAMEELRLLTNIQISGQPLLQIFLLGQPELRDIVLSPQMEQVHQRIVAASHLEGLEPEEVEPYVLHRLKKVGWAGDPAINRAIFPLIHKFSEGVPRRVNLICSRLLLHGCVESRHAIDVPDLGLVIEELQSENLAAGVRPGREDFAAAACKDWAGVNPEPQLETEKAEEKQNSPETPALTEGPESRSHEPPEPPSGARLRAVSETPVAVSRVEPVGDTTETGPKAERVEPGTLTAAPEPAVIGSIVTTEAAAEKIEEPSVRPIVEPGVRPTTEQASETIIESAPASMATVPDEPNQAPEKEQVAQPEEPKAADRFEANAEAKVEPGKVEEVKTRRALPESVLEKPVQRDVKQQPLARDRTDGKSTSPATARTDKLKVGATPDPGDTSQGVPAPASRPRRLPAKDGPASASIPAAPRRSPIASSPVATHKVVKKSIRPAVIAGLIVLVLAVLAVLLLPMLEEKNQWTGEGLPKASAVPALSPPAAANRQVETAVQPVDSVPESSIASGAEGIVEESNFENSGEGDGPGENISQDSAPEKVPPEDSSSEPVKQGQFPELPGVNETAVKNASVEAPSDLNDAQLSSATEAEETVPAPEQPGQRAVGESIQSETAALDRELLLLVSFPFDSVELTSDVLDVLNEAGKLLNDHFDAIAQITGFTDQSDDPIYNLDLSWDRARAVEEYLVSLGVERSRVTIEGRGRISEPSNESYRDTDSADRSRIVQVKIVPAQLR